MADVYSPKFHKTYFRHKSGISDMLSDVNPAVLKYTTNIFFLYFAKILLNLSFCLNIMCTAQFVVFIYIHSYIFKIKLN